MHDLRLYDPDYYCEIALRCDNGAYRFDSNDTDLRDETYGVFAEAVKRYAVSIFVFHFMSDHYHGLYGFKSPDDFVAFLAFLHGNLARLGHRFRGTHGAFWSPLKVMAVAPDAESVSRRVRYIMAQAAKEKIVDHPAQFRGASSIDAMLTGQPLRARRVNYSQKCRDAARLVGGAKPDADYETWTDLHIAVPQCWAHLSPEALQRLYGGIADEIAQEYQTRSAPNVENTADASDIQDGGQCPTAPSDGADPGPDLDGGQCPMPDLPPKQRAETREAEDGGMFCQGPVKPKDGQRRRSRPPRLFSVNPVLVAAYEERYKLAVAEYHAAKLAWRLSSPVVDGALRGAEIALPAWMLLGTLPLWLGRRDLAGVEELASEV